MDLQAHEISLRKPTRTLGSVLFFQLSRQKILAHKLLPKYRITKSINVMVLVDLIPILQILLKQLLSHLQVVQLTGDQNFILGLVLVFQIALVE